MSDILIRGMEMPKTEPLLVKINPDGSVSTTAKNGFKKYEAVSIHTPHGRLGDLDALYESCALDTNIDVMASAKRINEYMQLKIDEAPTIIPADEG